MIFTVTKENKSRISLLCGQLRAARAYLYYELKGIQDDILDFTPDIKTIETIGSHLRHIAHSESVWIQKNVKGIPLDPRDWEKVPPFDINLENPQLIGKPLKYYTDRLDQIREETIKFLGTLNDDHLDQVFEWIHENNQESGTLEWILFHMQRHEQHHIGQISLLKRLYALDYLEK